MSWQHFISSGVHAPIYSVRRLCLAHAARALTGFILCTALVPTLFDRLTELVSWDKYELFILGSDYEQQLGALALEMEP